MNKNLLIVIFSIIILVGITAGVISLFPYNPTKPPAVNFKGYTEQGVKDLFLKQFLFFWSLQSIEIRKPTQKYFLLTIQYFFCFLYALWRFCKWN